jgi:hypothetical protein
MALTRKEWRLARFSEIEKLASLASLWAEGPGILEDYIAVKPGWQAE